MIRRVLVAVGAVVLFASISVADAQAARHRSWAGRSTPVVSAQRYAPRSVVKPCAYPRTRQIDGKTLWDLGKQKGQWPTLP